MQAEGIIAPKSSEMDEVRAQARALADALEVMNHHARLFDADYIGSAHQQKVEKALDRYLGPTA